MKRVYLNPLSVKQEFIPLYMLCGSPDIPGNSGDNNDSGNMGMSPGRMYI